MRGYIDLHSHWVAGVDDGARSPSDGLALLRALFSAGFSKVIATPHMRPGMFNNTRDALVSAYEMTKKTLPAEEGLPEVALASEHFFDDVVLGRLLAGEGLPYPGERAVLVEFSPSRFPAHVAHRFFDLMRRRLRPVVAHPERYEPVWDDIASLDPLAEAGAVLLLDVAALVGRYGRTPRRAAERLLDKGYYYAACSDAHSVSDADAAAEGIGALVSLVGREEADFLLIEGPRRILDGKVVL